MFARIVIFMTRQLIMNAENLPLKESKRKIGLIFVIILDRATNLKGQEMTKTKPSQILMHFLRNNLRPE